MRSLRLLCLLSQTSDGVTQNEWQPIQKSHLHAHGYRHIPLVHKLETSGLLRRRRSMLRNKLPNWNSEWTTNAQRLKLLPGQSKRTDQKSSGTACPSYVFSSAYIPAIVSFFFYSNNRKPEEVKKLTRNDRKKWNCLFAGTVFEHHPQPNDRSKEFRGINKFDRLLDSRFSRPHSTKNCRDVYRRWNNICRNISMSSHWKIYGYSSCTRIRYDLNWQ